MASARMSRLSENAARMYVPLVQVPSRGVWGAGGQAKYASLQPCTGRKLDVVPSLEDMILRYLGAFGPASVLDMQKWSGLTRLKAVFEELRPRLRTFRDEKGRELFDLPYAPRPSPDLPAPTRFLGEYDNVLLGHADRRRIIPEDFPWDAMLAPGRFVNNLLVDGMLRGRRGGSSVKETVRRHSRSALFTSFRMLSMRKSQRKRAG
jgi:hypothetical protein